jgi:hypothetical protein
VDDVLITPCDSLASIKENQFINNEISLNILKDEIILKSKGEMIKGILVTSLTGQVIFHKEFISQMSVSFNCSLWVKEFYIVSIYTNKNCYRKKINIY